MGNVVDYVRREFHGFAELPFGDVDSLVLAELSYMKAMTTWSFRIPPI